MGLTTVLSASFHCDFRRIDTHFEFRGRWNEHEPDSQQAILLQRYLLTAISEKERMKESRRKGPLTGWFLPSMFSSSSQQGTGCIFLSLLSIECGLWAVKKRRSTGCVIRIKKTKMDPRSKITLKKKKKSGPGRTISCVYLPLKEKEKKKWKN